MRAALNVLCRVGSLKKELAVRCRSAAARMERAGVSGDPAFSDRRRTRTPLPLLGRLGAEDRQMLAAARLAFDLALPTEDAGRSHLANPDKDEKFVRRLFELAVAGFYGVLLTPRGWKVSHGLPINWHIDDSSSGIKDVLPSMQTDIVLERPPMIDQNTGRHRIVIDTKFTSILKPGWYRKQTLSSQHMYQIYAYLRSQECCRDPRSLDSTGVLLHPAVDEEVDEYAKIQGHKIRFATVNLAADSSSIRQQLLRIADAAGAPDTF